jgi:hypothetical protein
MQVSTELHFKDEILDRLANTSNVAQFVSYSPELTQRFSRVVGFDPNYKFETLELAVSALMQVAPEKSLNVRSFEPHFPKSREFVYGLKSETDVISHIRRLSAAGLYTIVNETIDIRDGGVSGVALGEVIEFAPEDTPRSVEKSGAVSLPRELGIKLLETVYHFRPKLDFERTNRVEFSIHPLRRGYKRDHTIIWEIENVGPTDIKANVDWSNRFSKFIGDKAYGLLIAYLFDLPVPATTVISRKVAPFNFGWNTGCAEFWIRTCPTEQRPGKYSTLRGWTDPFKLMAEEDPASDQIASVLAQNGVGAEYSGALISTLTGDVLIEGVQGEGDDFMLGVEGKTDLPEHVSDSVMELFNKAFDRLGSVRMEWVYDGDTTWVVQLHKGASVSHGTTIFPGEPIKFRKFDVNKGVSELRNLVTEIIGTGDGIELVGNVGITSHLGDILRKAQIPSRISSD